MNTKIIVLNEDRTLILFPLLNKEWETKSTKNTLLLFGIYTLEDILQILK